MIYKLIYIVKYDYEQYKQEKKKYVYVLEY